MAPEESARLSGGRRRAPAAGRARAVDGPPGDGLPAGVSPEWAAALPGRVAELAGRWSLAVGPPFQPAGHTAWVAPARGTDGADLVLKVGWRHAEAAHEAAGLRHWAGCDVVRLYQAEELGDTVALLLERCRPGRPLSERPEPEQDEVVAALLSGLWRRHPPAAPFRPLAEMCDQWADEAEATPVRPGVDAGLLSAGREVFRAMAREPVPVRLLCTDLHAGNVLSSWRRPWLAIDPKPYVGDPTYDLVQHCLNCPDRLLADPVGLCARLAGLSGVEAGRLRHWLFARCCVDLGSHPETVIAARELAP